MDLGKTEIGTLVNLVANGQLQIGEIPRGVREDVKGKVKIVYAERAEAAKKAEAKSKRAVAKKAAAVKKEEQPNTKKLSFVDRAIAKAAEAIEAKKVVVKEEPNAGEKE